MNVWKNSLKESAKKSALSKAMGPAALFPRRCSLLLRASGGPPSRATHCLMWSSFLLTFFLGHFARASFTEPTCLAPRRPIEGLTGLADVEWVRKGKAYRFDVAVRIDSLKKASFQAIDDFGNTLFSMHFSGESGSKVYAIPLSRSEVVAYLRDRWPESTKNVECLYNKKGELLSVEKKSKKKREAHLVLFSNFRRKGKFSYPHRIEIVDKKGSVKISWKQVDKIF